MASKNRIEISITRSGKKLEKKVVDGELPNASEIAHALITAMLCRRKGLCKEAVIFDESAEELIQQGKQFLEFYKNRK